jgi:ribosomal-protein-alanine N-acetyltransferase
MQANMTKAQRQISAHVRHMVRRDMREVLHIEGLAFEFPWHKDDFIRTLRHRNCLGMVAEYEDQIIGYMIYEIHLIKIHLLNFAVDPEYWRRGVGRQMLAQLIDQLGLNRRKKIFLEIRETNLTAQQFFRDGGFRAVAVLKEFYADSPEDGYLMRYQCETKQKPDWDRINRMTLLGDCEE